MVAKRTQPGQRWIRGVQLGLVVAVCACSDDGGPADGVQVALGEDEAGGVGTLEEEMLAGTSTGVDAAGTGATAVEPDMEPDRPTEADAPLAGASAAGGGGASPVEPEPVWPSAGSGSEEDMWEAGGAMDETAGSMSIAEPEPTTLQPGDTSEVGELEGMTAAHNAYRAMVETEPPLEPLVWDENIAQVAQTYAEELADACSGLVHSMGTGFGENLAVFMVSNPNAMYGSGVEAVDGWYSEVECYTYGPIDRAGSDCSSACDDSGGCGHYTQVIWRRTERVGCGVASCYDGRFYADYYVCNYDPPGNYIGQHPY